jgi:lysophospholipase L1-like esterase
VTRARAWTTWGGALALGVALAAPALAASGDCPAVPPRTPMPPEAVPGMTDLQFWKDETAALDAKLPTLQLSSRRLVFLGDSITAGWDPGLFSQFYGTRAPVLLGISGDGTQGVLARLPQEWGPLRPRLVVLLIGTNNLPYSTPDNIALGTAEIVRWIHRHSSETRILILGILPRGPNTADPLRQKSVEVNRLVAQCADNRTTFYADVGHYLVDPAGNLSNEIAFDLLHPTAVGYAIIATALEPEIKRIMGE